MNLNEALELDEQLAQADGLLDEAALVDQCYIEFESQREQAYERELYGR